MNSPPALPMETKWYPDCSHADCSHTRWGKYSSPTTSHRKMISDNNDISVRVITSSAPAYPLVLTHPVEDCLQRIPHSLQATIQGFLPKREASGIRGEGEMDDLTSTSSPISVTVKSFLAHVNQGKGGDVILDESFVGESPCSHVSHWQQLNVEKGFISYGCGSCGLRWRRPCSQFCCVDGSSHGLSSSTSPPLLPLFPLKPPKITYSSHISHTTYSSSIFSCCCDDPPKAPTSVATSFISRSEDRMVTIFSSSSTHNSTTTTDMTTTALTSPSVPLSFYFTPLESWYAQLTQSTTTLPIGGNYLSSELNFINLGKVSKEYDYDLNQARLKIWKEWSPYYNNKP